jgi:UDP-glucose 4-epimerase
MGILITGGNGFIGSCLLHRLLGIYENKPSEFIVIDKKEPFNIIDGVRYLIGDLNNTNLLQDACNNIRTVYHLAAYKGIVKTKRQKREMVEANVDGTAKLLKAIERCNLERFVYLSTAAVYGPGHQGTIEEIQSVNPTTHYAQTKYRAEELIRNYCARNSIPHVILRATSVFGEGHPQRHLLALGKAIKSGTFHFIDKSSCYSNVIYVQDVVDAIINTPSATDNIDSLFIVNTPMEIHNYISIYAKAIGVHKKQPTLSPMYGYLTSILGSLFSTTTGYHVPINIEKYRELTNRTIYSNDKICNHIRGFPQYGVEKGISITAKYYIAQGWL